MSGEMVHAASMSAISAWLCFCMGPNSSCAAVRIIRCRHSLAGSGQLTWQPTAVLALRVLASRGGL